MQDDRDERRVTCGSGEVPAPGGEGMAPSPGRGAAEAHAQARCNGKKEAHACESGGAEPAPPLGRIAEEDIDYYHHCGAISNTMRRTHLRLPVAVPRCGLSRQFLGPGGPPWIISSTAVPPPEQRAVTSSVTR
jgi:hypothetical protein